MMFFPGCHLIDLIYRIQGEPKIIPLNRSTGYLGASGEDFGMAILNMTEAFPLLKPAPSNAEDLREDSLS